MAKGFKTRTIFRQRTSPERDLDQKVKAIEGKRQMMRQASTVAGVAQCIL